MKKKVTKILGFLLAVALLAFLVRMTKVDELIAALKNLTLTSILYLAIISATLIFVSVIKWRMFIRSYGGDFSLWKLSKLYLLGYFVNSFLPSNVGGDLARSWVIGRVIGHDKALTATIMERYSGLFAMVALSLISICFASVVGLKIKLLVVVIAIGLICATSAILSRHFMKLLHKLPIPEKYLAYSDRVHKGLKAGFSQPALLSKAMGLSVIYHSLTVANTAACAYAVGWHSVSILDLYAVLPIILLIGGLPITPANLGIQEGAFYFFLHAIGASQGQALGIALILRVKSYCLGALGGLVFVSKGHKQ